MNSIVRKSFLRALIETSRVSEQHFKASARIQNIHRSLFIPPHQHQSSRRYGICCDEGQRGSRVLQGIR